MIEKQFTTAAQTVDYIIEHALEAGASDIHFEPLENKIEVRYRIDGKLISKGMIPGETAQEVIGYIKVCASMRMDEHRQVQDGRMVLVTPDVHLLHIRVSIMPTHYNEKIVLRLLPSSTSEKSFTQLGFTTESEQRLHQALQRTNGMIIVTGSTGSGKTTTLYHCMQSLPEKESLSVITLEDPIEYSLPGVTQIPIQETYGFTFQKALRGLLRHDPDVVMVGEMRDSETARLATQIALTGHLVLTTLHTSNALTALPRLVNMGVEPYLVATTVKLIVNQRLIPQICRKCKIAEPLDDVLWRRLQHALPDYATQRPDCEYRGQGCKKCSNTGFNGRIGIYEILEITDNMQVAILARKPLRLIKQLAAHEGMIGFMTDAWNKACEGCISFEELIKLSHGQ